MGWIIGNGNSFVFSLRDDDKFVKLRCLKKKYEVYHNADYLCCIGGNGASGFYIANDCNINTLSASDFGYGN